MRSSDGVQVGTVRRAQETGREHIFDGIVIDTKSGQALRRRARGRAHRRARVTLTISAAEAAELPPPGGGMRQRVDHATTVRRAKRWGAACASAGTGAERQLRARRAGRR